MASIKSIEFLPQIFRSETNTKFLTATLDQLTSEPNFQKISGFIGRKVSPGYDVGDTYITEPNKLRTDYQLEPTVSITDASSNLSLFSSYPDLLQKIQYHGGIINDHSRLFAGTSYNFNSLIDLDKFVNFSQYLWMPNGPPEVSVSAFRETPLFDLRVVRDRSAGAFKFASNPDGNPDIVMIRGETYTLNVDQTTPFWIQAREGNNLSTELTRLSRTVLGVDRNGATSGKVTFSVPLKDAQNQYTEAPSAGKVDFATDLPYRELQRRLLKDLEAKLGGIDGVSGSLDGRTLIFSKVRDDDYSWEDPGIYDFDPFDDDSESFSGGTNAAFTDRYNVWRIRIVEDTAGDKIIKLEPYRTIDEGSKITIKQGKTYAGVDFLKNAMLQWEEAPILTAPLDILYYQDGTDDKFGGRIRLVDPDAITINVPEQIIGQQNFTSANGVRFTNGMAVRFDNTAYPAEYRQNLYIVEGVGRGGITLVGAGNYVVPESFASTTRLSTPDYITIDRGSADLNAWTRSNRWFHEELIDLAAEYNRDSDIRLLAANYQRAQRPIIEFDPNIELYNHGSNAKSMVDILDFTVTNAFKYVEGQESFTFQLPNGKTKDLTAGMRVIFAGDIDPDVSNKIYQVQYITTSQGSQIHLVSQNTQVVPTYTVSDTIILENQAYSSIPTITYAAPYPSIGATTATGTVVLEDTDVASITASFGGLNYIANAAPYLSIDTAYTQAVRTSLTYNKHTYLEHIRINDGGLGYTDAATIIISSPNAFEAVTSTAESVDDVDYAAYQSTIIALATDPGSVVGKQVIGVGIPGGTVVTSVTADPYTVVLNRPVTVLPDVTLIFESSTAEVTTDTNRSDIITVDSTADISVGQYVSGGKTLLDIINITTGADAVPPVVTTSVDHGLVDGDLIIISQIEDGPTDLNNLSFYVNVLDSNSFALYTDATLVAPYDATESVAFNTEATSGTVTSKYTEFGLVGTKVTKIISDTQFQIDTTITLETGTSLAFAGQRATAILHVVEGEISSIWITNPGSGYIKEDFSTEVELTVVDESKDPGPAASLTPISGSNVLEYFTITNSGSGYQIGNAITTRVIDVVDEVTSADVAYGDNELVFASSDNIRYLSRNWYAFLVLDDGTYADFGKTPYLDATTGPDESVRQYYADVGLTSAVVRKVLSIDLVNNIVLLDGPINSLDNDGEVIDLPAGSKIHFTCKERYLTENNKYTGLPIGDTRTGYVVYNRTEYEFDAATTVSQFELDSVTGIQVGMLINDAANNYSGLRVISIEPFTNTVIVNRNLIIDAGTILYVSAAASVEVTLTPANIKSVTIDDAGAEYTAAPSAIISPIKTPVTKIISSVGDGSGDIIVSSLDGIDIGSVVTSEYQESGYGITTGGDVIRALSTRTVIEPGGAETYRVNVGIARYFTTTEELTDITSITLPNVIGLEVGMTLEDGDTFISATVTDVDPVTNIVSFDNLISIAANTRLRFTKSVPQPAFGDVYATFTVAARVAVNVTSTNVTITDTNDATPETYDVNDTVLVATATNPLQTAQGVIEYNQFTAVLNNNVVTWVPAQRKSKINQAPLFDVYDRSGYSLGNQTYYPGSKFAGTQIISYTDGTGGVDSVLGFRLKYKNFNSVGDIEFTNNFFTDTFTYLLNGVEFTQPIRTFDLRKYDPATGSAQRINQWSPVEEKTRQYQVFSYDFDGTTTYFEIDALPEESNTVPYTKVYLNNELIKESSYNITKVGARYALVIDPAIVTIGSKVDIKIYSKTVSKIGHFEIPVNLELNPFNSTFSTITLGQMRRHLVTMSQNHYGMTGNVLAKNNLRDVDYNVWEGSLLQHASPLLYANLFLVDKNADIVAAVENAAREYTRFKNRFLDMAARIELSSTARGVASDVDRIVTAVNAGKTTKSAWYNSDMVPAGAKKTVTSYPIIDAQRRRYELPELFNDTVLSNRAVIVYLDDPTLGTRTQLIKGYDFVFEKEIPAITLADHVVTPYTSFIVYEDYDTSGNYVPETPTKLGLYPKFRPMMYMDYSYQTPTMVIQGHDGSITPAFNDFRDKLLMELELRIYNNIKADYETNIVEMYDMIPGRFRNNGYSKTEFNKLLSKRFLKWVGTNRVDYTLNQWFETANPWTWNYNKLPDVIDGEYLPGFWRGAYKYFYDTDRPNITPWEMLGFSEEPSWWQDAYGPAPYTGANTVLWADLEAGYIKAGNRMGTDTRFARPGLSKFVPVDESGNLVSPEKLLISAFDESTTDSGFAIGDHGPVESAWRRSSDYPYALQIALAIGFPGQYLGSYIDTSRYSYDSVLQQFVHTETNSRISPDNIAVTDDGVTSGVVTHTAGYINWLKDLLASRGINGTEYLQSLIDNAKITLAYRMAGYSDKRYLTVIADQSSPGSSSVNIVVPDQNYNIVLNKSTPVQRIVYSGVIVEKTQSGYTVAGYDLTNPYFTIIPSVPTNNNYNISVLNETATIFKEYQPIKISIPYGYEFRTPQGLVDFLVSYQRYLQGQGFIFDTYNTDLGTRQDWILSAKEFLLWTQQGWNVGSLLALSPVFDSIKLNNTLGVIDGVENSLSSSKVLDQNFTLVKSNQYSVTRSDNQFTLSSLFGQTLALVDVNLVQYEHVMLFDNTTVFNDVLYQPELGIRQTRLKLSGHKTAGWTGQLNPPGLIYNNNIIDAWKSGTNYRRGSLVKFKDKIYLATSAVSASTEFDFKYWQFVNSNEIKTGLLPNFASKAEISNNIYDIDSHPVDEYMDKFSTSLIGFRQRDYLTDFNLDNTSQVKFYQGMIKQKGTFNSINALTKAQFSEIFNDVNVYEDWAVRIGEYGALGSDQQVEIRLDDSVYTENPSTVILNSRTDATTDGIINVHPDDIYGYTADAYDNNIIITRSANEQRLSDIVTAGYPRLDDVDGTLFDIRDVAGATSLLDKIGAGYKLWVAKDFNEDWNVYRITETNTVVESVDYSLDSQMTVNTDVPHNLKANDVIAIINFDADFNGLYLVVATQGSNSFTLQAPTNTVAVDRLRRQQSVVGTGVLFKAVSVRFNEINEIIGATPPNQWRNEDKIWIDDANGEGLWSVYQKTDGWEFSQVAPLREEDVRANDGYGTNVKISRDNQMIIVGAPGYSEGSLRGIRVLTPGNSYTDPDIVVSLPTSANGTQAIIEPVLSTGEILEVSLDLPGSGYNRPPEVVIEDTDSVTIEGYYQTIPLATTTRSSTTVANIALNSVTGLKVNDYFTNEKYSTAANIRIRTINNTARSVVLNTAVTVPTANAVTFVRDITNTVILTDVYANATTVAATTTDNTLALDTLTDISLDDVLMYGSYNRATPIKVLQLDTEANTVLLSSPVTIGNGVEIGFLRRQAFANDVAVINNGTPFTITGVAVEDINRVTLSTNLNQALLSETMDLTHGGGAILTALLEPTTIANVDVIDGGSGFSITPTLTVEGGGGSGAVLRAVLSSADGVRYISSVIVEDAGSGYTSEPMVYVQKDSPGREPVFRVRLTGSEISKVLVKSDGANYRHPSISFSVNTSVSGSTGTGSGAAATPVVSRNSIAPVILNLTGNAGTGYTEVPTVTVVERSANETLPMGSGATVEPIFPTGTVRCFSRTDSLSDDLIQISSMRPPVLDIREYGYALDIGTELAAVSAPGTYQGRGMVVINRAFQGQWVVNQIIPHPNATESDPDVRFGEAIALSKDENWLYVGAPGDDSVYVYAKRTQYQRQAVIDYVAGRATYFTGFAGLINARELRVLGNSGRVYEPNVEFKISGSNLVFASATVVTDLRIYVSRYFLSTNITPTRKFGVLQREYTLDSNPTAPEAITVLGASGTVYVLNHDYEIVNRNVIRFLNTNFSTEVLITVDAPPSYYELHDTLTDPSPGTDFGAAVSTNEEGYQVIIGAPKHTDTFATTIIATVTASKEIVVRNLSTLQVGYKFSHGSYPITNGIIVDAINAETNTVTLSSAVTVSLDSAVTFTSPARIGKAYLYDRSYERVVQKSNKPVTKIVTSQAPTGPVRVMIGRNILGRETDYTVEDKTIVFKRPVPYASSVTIDTNRFVLLQTFLPPEAVYNGKFGATVDLTNDAQNIVIGSPQYRAPDYYNGAVYRYINQALAYGTVTATRAPTINAARSVLKFNDVNLTFGGVRLDEGGLTSSVVASALNDSGIVGLNAGGYTQQFAGSSAALTTFAIDIIPDETTVVQLIIGNSTTYKLVKDTEFTFSYSAANETWQVVLTTGLSAGRLLVVQSPVTFTLTRGVSTLDILPNGALSPTVLGYDMFVLTQTIKNPSAYQSLEYFGTRVKFDETGETMLISSEGGTTQKKTTLDKGNTTIDRDSTRLIDILKGAGAVYVYDYLPTANPTLTDPARFLYNQNLQNANINFADNFGSAVDMYNGWALVGADRYESATSGLNNTGLVHIFRNPTKSKAWTELRHYNDKVDIDYINKLLVYDEMEQVSLVSPDYLDPNKGKILGTADQEIDYKTAYDPAFYTHATRTGVNLDPTAPWSKPQVGEVWWNLDVCRFIDYEQGSLVYRSQHWGEMFPGSTVEVLEWVESTVLPSQWVATVGDGVPKYADDSAYVMNTGVEEGTGLVKTYYYFWVLNKKSVGDKPTRTNSVVTLTRLIEDPANSGQPYLAMLAPNAFNLYGMRSYIKGDNSILRIEYARTREQQIKHNEFELLAENNPMSVIPGKILSKLVDSISGENTVGELVPDPFLIATSRVGIGYRPRQGMFNDQLAAIKVAVDHLNNFFKVNPVNDFIIDRLKTFEAVPEATFYQSAVANYETLTYIDKNTIYDGYRILVQADETVGNFWTIYVYNQTTDTYFLERIQNYDTTRYWSYVDWYAPGYSAKTKIDLYLQNYNNIQMVEQLLEGQIIRLALGPSGGWELYLVNADLTVDRIAQERGTIEFSSLLYQNVLNQVGFDTGGFDTTGFSKTTATELRNILEGIVYDIMVGGYDLSLNKFFFTMVYHALNEQKQVDWITKTSFISVNHARDQLHQIWNYTKDNQTYYEDFIKEVKPYRTALKQYLLDYTALEQTNAVVTDFDLPAFYDKSENRYRTLDPANSVDSALIAAGEGANWLNNFSYSIASIQILDGGEGYVNPLIVFSSPTGSGADGEVVATDGAITDILLEAAGDSYRDVPTIEITGSTGTGFSGTAVMGVHAATVVDPGANYQVGDILTYSDEIGTAVFTVAKVSSTEDATGLIDVVTVTTSGNFKAATWEGVATTTTGLGSGATFDLSYKVVGVDIVTSGEGYVTNTPRVVIEGGSGSGATARATVSKGKVKSVTLIDAGTGYKSTPTVRFVGSAGVGARAYVVLQTSGSVTSKTSNRVVRSVTTKLKFDRTAYTTSVSRWKPLTTYHIGDVVIIPDTVYTTYANLPDQLLPRRDVAYQVNKTLLASETFDPNQLSNPELFTPLSGADIGNALDRLSAYNRPGSPDRGAVYSSKDLTIFTPADVNSKIISLDNNWQAVAYSGVVPPAHEYRYAAVGNRTTMAVSRDGVTWIDADLRDTAVNLQGITFVNDTTWVAYGTNGTTFETTDGSEWTRKLIDTYYYSPSSVTPEGEVFSPAAATVDLVDATFIKGSLANYAVVVGDKGVVLMNSYNTDTQIADRWISARVPGDVVDIQYMFADSQDFGYATEVDGTTYDGTDKGVNRLPSGFFYTSDTDADVGLKSGLVVIGGVNGYVYFATFQALEDLANGYAQGYNFDAGKDTNDTYPWIKTVMPRSVRGLGDGYSGEHISGVAIGSMPDVWTVAVGSGGTLLWNCVDMFIQRQNGALLGTGTRGREIINTTAEVFIDWREFDASNFEYPLTKADLADQNFTDVTWDGERFVAVTDSNMVFWGYPGAKSDGYLDISCLSADHEVQSKYAAASWTGGTGTSINMTIPLASLTGVPSVGMLVYASGFPADAVVSAVSVNDSTNVVTVTVGFASTTIGSNTTQRVTFLYGFTDDISAGTEITFTGPAGVTKTLTVSQALTKGDRRVFVSDYADVGSNWTVSGAGIPTGARVRAVGKFAAFTWKTAPGSVRSNTRSLNSVVVNTTTLELNQPITGELPIGTTVTFFTASGSRYTKDLTQTAKVGTQLLTFASTSDVTYGDAVQALVIGQDTAGLDIGIPGSTTVINTKQYVLAGSIEHLEKDLADKIPGIAYAGVRVTGQAFTETTTDPDLLDTQITSEFTDAQLGVRPEDIIVDGGKFIDKFSSHAPEELVPGRITDLLQFNVFTKDPNDPTSITGFKIFSDQSTPTQYYRLSNEYTTTLTANLTYLDTQISVANIDTLPDPNPAANLPGSVFINGEKIIYLEIDRANGLLKNIRRGASRTSIPLIHTAGSLVSDASSAQVFETDFVTPLTADLTVTNALGNTVVFSAATTASITQGRVWLDLGE